MEKHILEQYTDLQREEKDLVRRIQSVTDKLAQMELSGYIVSDVVTNGKRGKRSLGIHKIQGFPFGDYEKKMKLLKTYKLQLELADERLLDMLSDVEAYINSIEDSRVRRIIRYRFVDGMSWIRVARAMGGNYTSDNCRMMIERFLERQSKSL